MTNTPDAPHDELACALWREEQEPCHDNAVVSVAGHDGVAEWGCEAHAGEALSTIDGAKISQVGDWPAARRLVALPWNHPTAGVEL